MKETLEKFFTLGQQIREKFSAHYELQYQCNFWWTCNDSHEVCWWDEKPESYEELEESMYGCEIYGSCIKEVDGFTCITYFDGCGNKISGIFDNNMKVSEASFEEGDYPLF